MIENLKISELQDIYFIGIGGIGMSALARYFNHNKIKVSGYDKVETTLTRKLVEEGIEVHFEDDPQLVSSSAQLVVYTPAIPDNHQELAYCKQLGIPVLKRSQVLGLLSKEKKTIAVAGTHGKTSTSSLITHCLTFTGKEITAFVGGIMKNFNSNFVSGNSDWLVVEADEYDRSFLTLSPDITVLISVDADHLDIYDHHDAMLESFKSFLRCTKHGGTIILHEDVLQVLGQEFIKKLKYDYHLIVYGSNLFAHTFNDIQARDSHFFNAKHNVENAIAASIISLELDVDYQHILSALSSFSGIKRRFELIYKSDQYCYIDDYAHHPTEINHAVDACRSMSDGAQITGIFQPHLYSRTKDFAEDFADALSKLDQLILLDIYPARELPIPGVSSDIIFRDVKTKKIRCTMQDLVEVLEKNITKFVLTIGAGDIDTLVPDIKNLLERIDGSKK